MVGATGTRARFGRLGRAMSVLRNYGTLSPERFEAKLDSFRRFLKANECPATFACTSSLLGRSQELVSFLKDFDVAIHGLRHIDYKNLALEEIEADLRQAISDFQSVGLEPLGFRAPYLRWNEDLIRAISSSGLAYDSSLSMFWDIGKEDLVSHGGIKNLLHFYSSAYERDTPGLPAIEEDIVRLPVSLPDDEILIERLMVSHPMDLCNYWLDMLKRCHKRSELLVLQVHPERFPICEDALARLLEEVRGRDIWVASLAEIASWWLKRKAVRVNVDSDWRIGYENPDGMVVRVWNETKETGDLVPKESLIRMSPSHPLYRRTLELGYIMTENSSSGFAIDEKVVRESEIIEMGREKGLLQKSLWPHGHRSAFCLTGDIDALSVRDFLGRFLSRKSRVPRRVPS